MGEHFARCQCRDDSFRNVRVSPVCADRVEKVLFVIGTDFLRAAGTLGVFGVGDRFDLSGFNSVAFNML
jgi:hypothetical protein